MDCITASFAAPRGQPSIQGPSSATTRYFIHGLGAPLLSEYVDQNGTPQWQVAYVYLGAWTGWSGVVP
ncbi:MAG: hypothetical protein NTV05_16065 [Acidobacteria bacterium]|nr:hypothetical protein [Acidobacteriota bacterium]